MTEETWENAEKIGDKFVDFSKYNIGFSALTAFFLIVDMRYTAYTFLTLILVVNFIPIMKRRSYERRKQHSKEATSEQSEART